MPYIATYISFIALQFTIYEKTMDSFRDKLDPATFQKNELKLNCVAGLLGGVIGAFFTNALESITVAKQTNPSINIGNLVREQGA